MAAYRPPVMWLPFDTHVTIVKLLNLKDALVCVQIAPVIREAGTVRFWSPYTARFWLSIGPGQIMLPDDTIMGVLHAHVRAEAITDFSVQSTFAAFTALE